MEANTHNSNEESHFYECGCGTFLDLTYSKISSDHFLSCNNFLVLYAKDIENFNNDFKENNKNKTELTILKIMFMQLFDKQLMNLESNTKFNNNNSNQLKKIDNSSNYDNETIFQQIKNSTNMKEKMFEEDIYDSQQSDWKYLSDENSMIMEDNSGFKCDYCTKSFEIDKIVFRDCNHQFDRGC